LYGGVQFGSKLTDNQAFELGFDHIAICTGAGAPRKLNLPNSTAKGVRTAGGFLIVLQSGGAFLPGSTVNLIIRMPIAVIGCGLTALDAAVEALNYYPILAAKFLKNYETQFPQDWSEEDRVIAEELIAHAKLFEQQKDKREVRKILEDLGGATIYYRGDLADSPAYKQNPDEVMHAMAAGVKFAGNMMPVKINSDKYDYVESIDFAHKILPAKTILTAIGTNDTILKADDVNQKYSYFGDCNPLFAGSVVKAMASSKYGYKLITEELTSCRPRFRKSNKEFVAKLDSLLKSIVN
jgi:NADPH-dependent glutamate synthase beta subunit-like oxidoreductase